LTVPHIERTTDVCYPNLRLAGPELGPVLWLKEQEEGLQPAAFAVQEHKPDKVAGRVTDRAIDLDRELWVVSRGASDLHEQFVVQAAILDRRPTAGRVARLLGVEPLMDSLCTPTHP